MASFIDFTFHEEYERVKSLGDKLSEIDSLINWESFRPIVKDMYDNKSEKGGHPIGIRDILRNKRISRKRAPRERHYAVIKNVFKSGHTMVTTLARIAVKMVFASFGFNLFQLLTLKNQETV